LTPVGRALTASDLSLRQLRYFSVLGRELNYRRAAEVLFVTQPAISLAIKQLETELGVKLFIRDTRSVALTDAGRMWLPKVNAALGNVDQLAREIDEWARGAEGTLRIGYLVGIGTAALIGILPEFEARYPMVRVEALEFDFSDPTAGLASGAVDIALTRPPVNLPWHDQLVIESESWVVCLPRGHRFAERSEMKIRELLDEPIVAAPESAGAWRDYWIADDVRGGEPAKIAATASTYESEFTAVSRGLGISFTTSAAGQYYQRPGIVFVPIVDRGPADIALVWKRASVSSQAMRFIAIARELSKKRTRLEPVVDVAS
jgi:DNA-binding transcriptional LysR family regulator